MIKIRGWRMKKDIKKMIKKSNFKESYMNYVDLQGLLIKKIDPNDCQWYLFPILYI